MRRILRKISCHEEDSLGDLSTLGKSNLEFFPGISLLTRFLS